MENAIQKINPDQLTSNDVRQYVCPSASEKEIFLFLQIAKSCNLNPFLNQIYLVKYGDQKAQILTSYNVYLQRAERSGNYAGLETSTEGTVERGDLKAIVKVFRKDWDKPLIHEVYYSEYVQYGKDQKTGKQYVNKFWREKPRTMTIKVAISQAFRLAFPLDFEGMPYTSDEINTVDIPSEKIEDVKEEQPPIDMPQEKEQVDPPADQPPSKSNCYECSKCAKVISQKVFNYSKRKYGNSLCFECQGQGK